MKAWKIVVHARRGAKRDERVRGFGSSCRVFCPGFPILTTLSLSISLYMYIHNVGLLGGSIGEDV